MAMAAAFPFGAKSLTPGPRLADRRAALTRPRTGRFPCTSTGVVGTGVPPSGSAVIMSTVIVGLDPDRGTGRVPAEHAERHDLASRERPELEGLRRGRGRAWTG